ncbi:OpgC domain-containing protein [Bradyrhizobium sp. JYMT SZCCT0428]|uniref:OpgC domain-containing protein n=1 Tax=Bradyrhizobium sp. JYMT SZCCT0428 TaxID=2807673 RepID=UPI001BAA0FE3|nr:OpgC domain-containing protein [Bradyrhizobium sp. JYMT SZCCT0428]MBR1151690.1 OpgC domain-containing protein [Bradyrhizobium sp. JYMT SZCCT0428]
MSVATALPPSKRDLRLDLFRGLANWAMFLGHIPSTVLAWLTFRNYGFSDGADLFVFISGYTSASVYTRKMSERGFVFGATRLLKRVWQIYAAHVLLFVFYISSIHFLSHKFNAPDFIDQFNVAPLTNAPVEALVEGLVLKYKPVNLDVLPLYVVLMGSFPPILWLMLKHRNWIMFGSVLLYFAARQFGWNFPSYPSGVWYFNPFAWQLLFVLGAWLALGGADTLNFLVRSRLVFCVGVTYLLFATIMTFAAFLPELQAVFPRFLFDAFNPNDKTNLAPYRFLHLALLIIVVARIIPIDAPGLRVAIWRPLVKCGQQSLEVFCVGIYLSFIAYFILEATSDGVLAQLLVGAGGLSIMTAVAYYRSWSKRVEKSVHADLHRPIGEEGHLPIGGLCNKGVASTV